MSFDIWDWYETYSEKIYDDEDLDPRYVEMLDVFDQALDSDDNPQFNIKCLRLARKTSASLQADLFTLWCDVWLAQHLTDVGEIQQAMEILRPAAEEGRDTKYDGTPQQIMASSMLANNLADSDPLGHAEEIQELFRYVRSKSPANHEHTLRVVQCVTTLAIESAEWQRAERLIEEIHDLAANIDPDDLWAVGYTRAKVDCLRGDWDKMLEHVNQAFDMGEPAEESEGSLLLAKACALAGRNELEPAAEAFQQGWQIRQSTPDGDDYLFATHYWLNRSDPQQAIETRLKQQADIDGKGRHWEQACGAEHLIKLYEACGQATEAASWRSKLAEICQNLGDPSRFQPLLQANS